VGEADAVLCVLLAAQQMKKYREGDFGVCPRALCDGQPVVPVRVGACLDEEA
jgi:hypothetical protein